MSGRMRVLHILPSIRGYGAEGLVVELLKHLSSSDIDAALLTIYESPPDACAVLPFTILNSGRKSRKDRLFIARLIGEIRRFRPDIVHTHTHVGKYWGRMAAVFAGVRCIVHTEHNPCDFRRTILERVADRLLHPKTACVVTFFREQAASLGKFEHLPANKLTLIPNAVTQPQRGGADRAAVRKSLEVPPNQFAIAVVGRMEFQKNQMLALRALAELRSEIRNKVTLYFLGSGKEEVVLRGLSRALDIAERVRFLGFRSDVPALLTAMDLVLMTSWFEGMPLALLEAMAAGVPILSTPWIGARDMLGDGRFGFITSGYDPPEVAAAIERAVTRPILRHEMARRAHRYACQEFGMERMIDAHRNLYLQLRGAAS